MFDIRRGTLQGVKWTSISAFASRGVSFLLGIILARLLMPSDYGVVGMVAILFAISEILIDGGMGAALIREKEATDEDTSTVFYFNIAVSIICGIVLCIASSAIARFFRTPALESIVKVTALSMVIGSFGSVQWVLCTREVDFRTPALIRLPVQLVTGIVAVCLAYQGFGPWAIVLQSLISTLLSTIAIWIVSRWRPKLVFSVKSVKKFLGFGGNLVVNSVLDKFYNEGVGMVIGKYHSPSDLGYYSKGQGTSQLPSTFIFNLVGSVLFPVLSKVQDDDERLIRVYRKFMRILSMVIFFGMFLMIALARPITIFLYSEKWIPAIIYMQIFAFRYMIYHIHALNWNLLMVKGRSDLALKKEIINKTINFSLMLAAVSFSPVYIATATAVASVLNIFVNTIVADRLLGFGFKKQCADFMPYMIYAVLATIPALLLTRCFNYPLVSILLGAACSFLLYFGWLFLIKDESLYELIRLLPCKNWMMRQKGRRRKIRDEN